MASGQGQELLDAIGCVGLDKKKKICYNKQMDFWLESQNVNIHIIFLLTTQTQT